MTVIEHYLVRDARNHVGVYHLKANADRLRDQGCEVEGPFVPADALQGAVEAGDALAAMVKSVLDSLAFAAPEAYALHLGRLADALDDYGKVTG